MGLEGYAKYAFATYGQKNATYDAAFDKHLISFDEDYKMVVSPIIKEHYTREIVKEYLYRFEGKQLTLPSKFYPNKEFLAKHLGKLVCT